MSAGLVVFWAVFALVSVGGTVVAYPGVKKRVPSRLHTFLGAAMSATLLGAALAVAAGALVNALTLVFRG